MGLIRWLEAKQVGLGMTNTEFGPEINITPEYWGMLRRGIRRLTLLVARNAMKRFPEDREEIARLALSAECADPESARAFADSAAS